MIPLIEKTLETLVPPHKGPLYECASYSLSGGKRLRPQLTLAVADAYKVPFEKGVVPACVLELIHTYSLIHDDLPCMDNDDMRRNKPSLHRAYSENLAVLTGDFLLTYAFEILSEAPHLNAEQKNRLILTLARRSGIEGMIGGQFLDITKSPALLEMQIKKTAALITAALEFGGIIAHCEDLTTLQCIGEHLGLAFQLVDDLYDKDGAFTLFGPEKTQHLAEEHFAIAQEAIETLPQKAPLLFTLAHNMILLPLHNPQP